MMRLRTRFGPVSRISLVLAYGLTAFLVAGQFGEPGPGRASQTDGPAVSVAASETSEVFLSLQASREIGNWVVTLDGAALSPDSADSLTWSGRFRADGDLAQRLVIDLTPSDAGLAQPLAVRLELSLGNRTTIRSFWASGDLIESIDLAESLGGGETEP